MSQKEAIRDYLAVTTFIMANSLALSAYGDPAGALPAFPPVSTNAPAGGGTNTTKLPEVVVEGRQVPEYKPEKISSPKYTAPLRDTPQTINVVPRKVIEDQNATTLRDVLRNVPGISFQAGEGGVPAGDQLSIRGFSARTDLFVDGVRDVGGYTRDSFNVEQVEVFKGPNSVYSGRGSTGGSVNMVTKNPNLDPSYSATLGYGSDEYFRATADLNQPLPELSKLGIEGAAFRINGLYHDQDFAGRDYIHDNRWAVNPTFTMGLGSNTRLTLQYSHLQENNLAGYGLPFVSSHNNPYGGYSALGKIAPLPFDTFVGLHDRDHEDVHNDIAGLRLEHDFSDSVKLQNHSSFGRTDRDSIITAPRIIPKPTADPIYGFGNSVIGSDGILYGLNHELQSRDQVTDIFANQTDFRTDFDTGIFGHALVTSLEFSHETDLNYIRSATVGTAFPYAAELGNPFDPNSSDPFHPVSRTGAKNQTVQDTGGISAYDTIKITEQWFFNLGVRGDITSTTLNLREVNGATTKFDRSDSDVTWRSGLVYKPVPNGSIYFGYGTSFNPTIDGLTLNQATVNTNLQSSFPLDPEKGQSFELGTKWDVLNQRLSLSGALFRSHKENFRSTDPVTQIVSNVGDVRVQGIELGVSGKLNDKWNVSGGYAFMESDILKSINLTYDGVSLSQTGHQLSNTPRNTASLSTTYELPKRITIGTSGYFVDKRYSNNLETQSAPSYALQDVFLSWNANKYLDLRLNVSNIWDKDYLDRVGGGHAIPGTGRTVILTASLKY